MRYTREDKERLLADWVESGMPVAAFCRRPGTPGRNTMREWLRLAGEGRLSIPEREVAGKAGPRAPWQRYGEGTRAEAVRLVRAGSRPCDVARRLGVSGGGVVRSWVRKASGAGTTPWKGAVRMDVAESERVAELERELAERDREIDVLREMVCDPKAGDPGSLSNSGKAELGERLRAERGWRLRDVLTCLRISKSSYEYARRANEARGARRAEVDALVAGAFEASGRTYGYRRVWAALGGAASQREVRDSMRRQGLRARRPRARRPWSSYGGEVDERPANAPRERARARRAAGEDFRRAHDFSAGAPGELAVTDVTEFRIPAGRVYLSPVIDCFDGEPAAWSISAHPDKELCEGALRGYLEGLPEGSSPLVHSDGGAVYRTASWKALCAAHGAGRSMSRKACCPDNARAEGFFGTVKEEFFYGRDWSGCTLRRFVEELGGYLAWYVGGRLKAFGTPGGTVYDTIAHRREVLGYNS